MLREGDWLGINQILLSLYSVRDINILTQCVMPMLRSLIPYTSGYFLIYDMDGELDVEHSYFYRMQENVKKLYLEQYYGKDYLNGVVDLRSQTITYRDTDILEKELRKHTEIYREFFGPNDIPFGSGIILYRDSKLLGIINLFRSTALGDFSERDMYILNVLKDHMAGMVGMLNDLLSVRNRENDLYIQYGLSMREQEVGKLVIDGLSNQEIGDRLKISLSTVKKHIYSIFNKTGVESRARLIAVFRNDDL